MSTFSDYDELKSLFKKRGYDVTLPTYERPMKRSVGDANVVVGAAGLNLRQQVRHSEQNYDITNGIFNTLTARTIGAQIIVEPQVLTPDGDLNDEVNDQIENLLEEFSEECEVTGLSLGESERLMFRTWIRDGESLCQHVMGLLPDIPSTRIIPYSFQLLEPDYLPYDFTTELAADSRIRHGIELNRWRRPIAYHILEEHPESEYFSGQQFRTFRIPAERMSHIALRTRIGQLRGVSLIAPALARLVDVYDYDQSERIANKLAAKIVGAIIKDSPDGYDDSSDDTTDQEDRAFELVSGALLDDLKVGEKLEIIDTKRNSDNYKSFRSENLRSATGGTMVSYSSVSNDYGGTYSSQRQESVEKKENYRILLNEFVSGWRRHVHRNMVTAGLAVGRISNGPDVDQTSLTKALYYSTAVPWVDPENEAKANSELIASRQASLSEMIRSRGRNPRAVARQIKADRRLFGEMTNDSNGQDPGDSIPAGDTDEE